MQPGNTIRRTSAWGDVVIRENIDEAEVKKSKELMFAGFDFEVLKDGKFIPVPRRVIHQKEVPEVCTSCEA